MRSFYTLLLTVFTIGVFAQTPSMKFVSRYETGLFDEAAAEIVAYGKLKNRLFFTNSFANTVSVLDVTVPALPQKVKDIDMTPYGGGVNSVTIYNNLVAVAVEADDKQDNGKVVFFDLDGNYVNDVTVGALPDMVTFTPNGNFVLSANEGEPSADYSKDPNGSVSIIDVSAGAGNINQSSVTTVDFSAFNGMMIAGARNFGPASVLVFNEDLDEPGDTLLGDFKTYSRASNADWEYDFFGDGIAEINGFGANTASDDWLMVANLNLQRFEEADLSFITEHNFSGGSFEVLVSTNYDGTSDPINATWDTIVSDGSGTPGAAPYMEFVSRYETGLFDEGAAEIVAYSENDEKIFFSNAFANSITILDFEDPHHPTHITDVSLAAYGGGVNSVAVYDNMVAVAVEANVKQDSGSVVFFDLNGVFQSQVTVGALPDMLTFSPDGDYVIVANEGEPNDDYLINPKGSVSIIDISGGVTSLSQADVTTLDFTAYDGQTITGGRVGENSNVELVFRDFEEAGDTSLPGFIVYDGLSTDSWIYDSFSGDHFAEFSNFGADTVSEDWLILPGIDFTLFNSGSFNFDNAKGFSGNDIEVLVSTNYVSGDPNLATWDTLTSFATLSTGSFNDVNSGDIDLSNYLSSNTSIAWLSAGSGTSGSTAATWQIDDIQVWGEGVKLSHDLEPEYIAVNASSDTAYAFCQENNIVAIIDIVNESVVGLKGLGYKNHGLAGNGLDPSDKDSINIRTFNNLFGIYMPDAAKSVEINGMQYLVTANEGDGREYEGSPGFVDEDRIKDLTLDPTAFPNAATLQSNNELGRLTAVITEGDTDGDGDYDVLYSQGARSFSIWDRAGNLVWDSGDDFEQIIADSIPAYFGFSNDDHDPGDFDSRSDAKGPEPEAIEIGQVAGRTYAFIGLERIGGIMMYDITNPTSPQYIQYINSRDFTAPANSSAAGDLGPEDLKFISADKSPNGRSYLISSNEVSGTVAVFEVKGLPIPLSAGGYEDTYSGKIDISNHISDNTTIAFHYTSNGTGGGQAAYWAVDEVMVTGFGLDQASDWEPEYIAVHPSGDTAYVALQENNAVAVIDIPNATVLGIAGLGFKDHSIPGNDLDASDRDSINIKTWNNLYGMYQPDAMKAIEIGGATYILTANEGDAREYDVYEEEDRVKDLVLDSAAFPAANIQDDDQLGRLTVTTTMGDTDGDGDYDELYAFGARSFSIWDAQGNLVWDSGDDLERLIADSIPNYFGFSNDDHDPGDFDSRSDAKGPEPEAIEVATVDGKTYAWVGLERIGGVAMYEITNPTSPVFIQYINTRNFAVDADSSAAGDLGPEDIKFIRATDSPDGNDYLVVANEVSGTVAFYQIEGLPKPNYELQILHASDLEGGVEAIDRAENFAALADRFEQDEKNTIIISSGDNYIPGPFFNAAGQGGVQDSLRNVYNEFYGVNNLNDLRAANGRVDISIMNIIGFDAATFGNHEFDAGTDVMEDIISPDIRNNSTQARWFGSQFPYISANLDFSNSNLGGLYTPMIMPADSFVGDVTNFAQAETRNKIAPATIIERSGEKIGVVGATTQLLASISSPGTVNVLTGGANDMVALAGVLQPYIDSLSAMGVNKIIVSSHLQQFALEQQLAGLLNNVDIIIAGGSDFLLADGNDVLRPGDVAAGPYPTITQDALGNPLAIISTDGQYSYLGRLVVEFDTNGVIIPSSVDTVKSGAWATLPTIVNQEWATAGNPFAKGTEGRLVQKLVTSVKDVVIAKDSNVVGMTNVYLEGRRSAVRTEETNLGNLTADANLWMAKKYDPSVMVSIKNGGGIRAEIGVISEVSPGVYQTLPPQPNPISGRDSLEVSQLDLENSLRFNNQLSVLELTASGLKDVIEHSISAWAPGATPGQFCQVGGLKFSFDPNRPAGSRIQSMVIIDSVGNYLDTIVATDKVYGNPSRTIKVVTLNFLAGGGDSYPFPALGANRVDLDSAISNLTLSYTASNPGGEQDALAEYMLAKHSTPTTAFNMPETDIANDERIQNLSFRPDSVLPVNYRLQVLHASDLEGGVQAIDRAANFAAIIDELEEAHLNTITISSGDNYIPGPFFSAASQSAVQDTLRSVYNEFYGVSTLNDLRTDNGRVDISIMNVIGFDASTIGNHDFDAGPSVMANIISPDIRNNNTQARWLGAQFPYLSANLNFSGEPSLAGLYESQILAVDSFVADVNNFAQAASRKKIAPAAVIERGGELIGVVGATTQLIQQITSPGGVTETTGGSNDMPALAAVLQPIINDMVNNLGVNKVIVSSHLQQFALEQQLAGLLDHVDIIIAGGSDYLLADGSDILRPGDAKQGPYPFLTTNNSGDPLAIISTDGEYSYVGRLVVEFDQNGVLIPSSVDSLESGAFATLDTVVNMVYNNSGTQFNKGTKGRLVQKLTDAVRNIVVAKDGNVFGKTNVYLEGRRNFVRTEETNMGNITADANLWVAKQFDTDVMVSLKNGGGIRAEIGEVVEVAPGLYNYLPPQPNPISGKDSLEISQLDIENALRFNNRLSVVEVTASGLRDIVEHGISATLPGATPGQFPQVGGLAFSYDTTLASGSKIVSMVIIDTALNYLDTIVKDGNLMGNPNRTIKMVTLNFLAGGGDGYPFPTVGANRVDLDTALTAAGNATFTVPGSEQDALAEYLLAFHSTTADAYNEAETDITVDFRIEQLNVRPDDIFPPVHSLLSPADGGIFDIEGPSNQLFIPNWTSNGVAGTNYIWQLTDPLGNPLLTIPAGTDTFIVFDYGALDGLLASGGVSIGGSIPVNWEVFAANGTDTVPSENGPFSVIMRRRVVTRPYALVSPADGTTLTVQGDPTQTVDITWESVKYARGNGDVNYTWLLDAIAGDFSNPLAAVPSNNSGNDTTLTLDFGTIVGVLNTNGVAVGTTFNGKWTVVANVPNVGNDTATAVWNIDIAREEMTSVAKVMVNQNVVIYPNPAQNQVNVMSVNIDLDEIRVFNAIGQEVYRNDHPTRNTSIDLGGLDAGMYFVRVLSGKNETISKLQIVK